MTAPLPRIRCAVCNKPVDRVIAEYYERDRTTTLRVWCHGATDAMVLPDAALHDLTQADLRQLQAQEGVAFARPAIAE